MTHKVLIIDDDEELCMELKEILADEGYEVSVAMDGLAGKGLIEQQEYKVVILDLKLPRLNGYEVLKAARKFSTPARIIVLSGRPLGKPVLADVQAQEEEELALKLADEVLNKPVSVPALIKKVSQYIKKN